MKMFTRSGLSWFDLIACFVVAIIGGLLAGWLNAVWIIIVSVIVGSISIVFIEMKVLNNKGE